MAEVGARREQHDCWNGVLRVAVVGPFRTLAPTVRGRGLLLRPRLLEILARRFDVRLTTVVGAAGFGKTVLLAQAIEQNELVPIGKDVWIGCEAADSDASVLGRAVLQSLGADPPSPHADMAEVIVEVVWNLAPFDVVLIFDDLHELSPGSTGLELVARLVRGLPGNGHLLLASRQPIPLPLSKLRASAELVEISSEALSFDDRELKALGREHSRSSEISPDEPRWPAVVMLVADAGREAAVDFLSEEVLDQRPEHERRALALVSTLPYFDQELLEAVAGTGLTTTELLDGLPLTMVRDDGTWQLHELWRPVLTRTLSAEEQSEALVRGAECLLRREEFVAAGTAFSLAGDLPGLERTAVAMCFRPLTRSRVDESRQLHRLLPPSMTDKGVAKLLEAFSELELRHQWRAQPAFEEAARALRQEGLPQLEIQALLLASQVSGVKDGLPPAPHLYPRAVELAKEGLALAQSMAARFESYRALVGGDPQRAMQMLKDFKGFGPVRSEMLSNQLYIDAGHPELAGELTTTSADLEASVSEGVVDLQLGLALWFRGDIAPPVALSIARELMSIIGRQQMSFQSLHAIAMSSTVALACGDLSEAKSLARDGRRILDSDLGILMAAYLDVGDAVIALAEGEEETAGQMLREVLDRIPLGQWPPRPYMHVLSPLYVLCPETRPLLDSLKFGPSLAQVISASQALVQFRESGNRLPLQGLNWRQIGVLRANIAVPHLVEMALGAGIELDSDRYEPAQRLTPPRQLLAGLTKSGLPVAQMAKSALSSIQESPKYRLRLCVLGAMRLYRDGDPIESEDWVRRERVRTLCGYLVHHPSVSRREIAAALWPDRSEDKAQSNLRVNLRHLLSVFEPDRPSGGAPWFMDAEGPTLNLRRDRIVIDVVEFDDLISEARRSDERGIPGQALELYREAADLFGGDYLEARSHDAWAEFERIRLRSAAALACARVAELLLAKGEPEASMQYASKALSNEPLLERAHRCRVRAFLGLEDRGAAREAGRILRDSLGDAGLAPEPDSLALLASLGLAASLGRANA